MDNFSLLITGGAGFIGSNLAEALIQNGFHVHIIDNLSAGKKENIPKGATLHEIDIRDLKAIQNVFNNIGNVSYVFHLAALPRVQFSIENPHETSEVNIIGTVNMLIASHKAGIKKFIYSASSSVYGDQEILPLHEEMKAIPKSPYGLQKYIGELKCKMFSEVYGLPTVSLRYFNVYGPKFDPEGAYALVIGVFLKQKKEGKPLIITGDGEQTRDFTHVRDVVRANILAMQSDSVGKGEVINIGAGNNITINKLAELIGGDVEHISSRLEPKHTLADIALAKKLLNWEPEVNIEEGIADLKRLFKVE
jgi:nucleoside-diphosphate-sugar epimerase